MSPGLRQSFGRDLLNADLAPELFSVDTDLARRRDPEFYAVPIDRNHGDRQLDTAPSAIEILAEVICLSAKGVGIGRPFLYAMNAYGEPGGVCAM